MGILETVIAGLIVAAISGGTGYGIKAIRAKKKIRGAPRKYVERIGEMIDRAYEEGPGNVVVHAKAIVATRDSLRGSLQQASSKLNSQIDALAESVGLPFQRSESWEVSQEKGEVNSEKAWEMIQVLKKYWPAKGMEIEYEIKKILAELDLD
ncbi:hypothetical protein [Vreelandella venusta]|uniref:hypothetical protein n=1 Tax=Vreelandella venusta TaxID=44935 RepID=UPI0018DAE7AD|nr:hypothetical protein [Halomonas venusta]QPI65543.1 hypothetical protein IR195_07545 [Halomonas venusta]